MKKKKQTLLAIIQSEIMYDNNNTDACYCLRQKDLMELVSRLKLSEIKFSPTANIAEGRKFETPGSKYDDGAIFLKWHSPDSLAPDASNSKIMWTAQIRYTEKVGNTYRFLYIYVDQLTGKVSFSRFPKFETHVPVLK